MEQRHGHIASFVTERSSIDLASYLKRYQAGERVQVWQELVALGDEVRSEPLLGDARAVARETMRRVRYNTESIHSKLQKIGYKFQFPGSALSPPLPEQIAEIDEFERQVGPVPLSLRAWAETVGSVNFMGTHPGLSYCEKRFNPFAGVQAAVGIDGRSQTMDLASLMPTKADLDKIPPEFDDALSGIRGAFANLLGTGTSTGDEARTGPPGKEQGNRPQGNDLAQAVLGSMRDAFAKATNPNKAKNDNGIPEKDRVLSDPLVLQIDGLSLEQYEAWQELEDDELPFSVILAPGMLEKANKAGDVYYEVLLPDGAADFLVRNTEGQDTLFVEYLRSSFEWAGFRELRSCAQYDEALLESLKEGLQPF